MLSPEDLAARTERATRAAADAARELGVVVTEPRVIYDVFSVVVVLDPSPVIARVPTVLPRSVTPEQQKSFQRNELDVTRWLAGRGEPTVVPSPLVPAEPVQRDGFGITFWELIEGVTEPELETGPRFALTARLHSVLREYPGDPGFLAMMDGFLDDALEQLDGRADLLPPEDLDRARREWAVFAPLLASEEAFLAEFPDADLQVVHGDAPYYNLIETPGRVYFSDFEHVTRGPVEWDLAAIGDEGVAAYDAEAAKFGLRPVDPRLLRVMEALRNLQIVGCLPMVPELPLLADGLKPVIEHWRSTEFAGGLG
ncbi:phosphotransferase family protein [Amycolatopsis sp. 195334CR]|uniref:phosphotransferase family protein n=1 Tax=Amycolatopsis sp. 195334CR TaxID=2814588 RepID=UPI001A8DB028|nr:aminoglycoside phosphotransferase family protein [Amycolatopsis sp. 195334CR]MBN6037801.1 aminoglycoside phosphotransferase family protein [Amycolatopsis sp. 195334CR]